MLQLEKNEENILYCKKFIDDYCANGLDVKKIEEFVYLFQPVDAENNKLVHHIIINEQSRNVPYFLAPDRIVINIIGLVEYVKKISNGCPILEIKNNIQRFNAYMTLFVLIHEIAHSYQYFIGQNKIESPCKLVSETYNILFNIIVFPEKDIYDIGMKRFFSLIRYRLNQGNLILERNANIEAGYLMVEVAKYCEEKNISDFLTDLKYAYLLMGYSKNIDGSIKETFYKMKLKSLYDKINQNDNLSMSERVRYGLEIDEVTREKVLSLDMRFLNKKSYL